MPAKHGDIPNAYVKANKESHLDIFSQVPQGMNIDKETLKNLGVLGKKEVSLNCASACAASSKPVDSGVSYCMPSCAMQDSHGG